MTDLTPSMPDAMQDTIPSLPDDLSHLIPAEDEALEAKLFQMLLDLMEEDEEDDE